MDILILTVSVLAVAAVLAPMVIHRAYRAPRLREQGSPADLGLPFASVRIPTANGKGLFAWLVPPAGSGGPAPAVAVIHGWGGNAEQMLPFAGLFHHAGYGVLLLDARNHGNSDSDDFSSMPRFAEDLEQGLDWLARQPDIDPGRLVLLGHSVGAAAALLVASRRHDPAAVISIAAFAHPGTLMHRQMQAHHIPYRPFGWLVLRFIERTIGMRLDAIAPCNTLPRATCPVLLVQGEDDRRVPLSDARRLYANRRDDRTELLILAGTGHESRDAIRRHGGSLLQFLARTGAAPGGYGPTGRLASTDSPPHSSASPAARDSGVWHTSRITKHEASSEPACAPSGEPQ